MAPLNCPLCGESSDSVFVLQDEDDPFACAACLEGHTAERRVPIEAAAVLAWPDIIDRERRARCELALTDRADLVTDGGCDLGQAVIDLVNAAARIVERGGKAR